MLISILICSIKGREHMLNRLLSKLNKQIAPYNDIEIIVNSDNKEKSIGQKRNELLKSASGEYVAFIDDDDDIAPFKTVPKSYIDTIYEALKSKPDCLSLSGYIKQDNSTPKLFIHSLKYVDWYQDSRAYYRPPNHLNCIKREYALKIGFPDLMHGEDFDFSDRLAKSGLLKKQVTINTPIYYYLYKSRK